jgi:hypothetical protein
MVEDEHNKIAGKTEKERQRKMALLLEEMFKDAERRNSD